MTELKKIPHLKRNTIAGVVGNVLEWYDFAVFGFFAPIIGTQFFPSESKFASLLSVYGVFAAGYLTRPFGGIIFGHIGDKFGRKRALQLSILMMAIPTVLLGTLPTFAQVGILAAGMLVLLRLCQGVSVGGELIGSITFVSEIAPKKQRGLFGSLTICSATTGVMLGSAVASFVHWTFTTREIQDWAWRLPFLAGIVIGFFGLWMRRGMIESPDFELENAKEQEKLIPLIDVLRTAPGRLLNVTGLVMLGGVGFYMVFVWWPTYLTQIIIPPVHHALLINTLAMAVVIVFSFVGGHLSDLFGRRRIMAGVALLIAITAYPLFVLTDHAVFTSALIAQFSLAAMLGIYIGIEPVAMIEQFQTRNRYTGVAVGYNVTLAIFGGTTPLICTWLIKKEGLTAPAFYLIGMAIISFVAACFLRSGSSTD